MTAGPGTPRAVVLCVLVALLTQVTLVTAHSPPPPVPRPYPPFFQTSWLDQDTLQTNFDNDTEAFDIPSGSFRTTGAGVFHAAYPDYLGWSPPSIRSPNGRYWLQPEIVYRCCIFVDTVGYSVAANGTGARTQTWGSRDDIPGLDPQYYPAEWPATAWTFNGEAAVFHPEGNELFRFSWDRPSESQTIPLAAGTGTNASSYISRAVAAPTGELLVPENRGGGLLALNQSGAVVRIPPPAGFAGRIESLHVDAGDKRVFAATRTEAALLQRIGKEWLWTEFVGGLPFYFRWVRSEQGFILVQGNSLLIHPAVGAVRILDEPAGENVRDMISGPDGQIAVMTSFGPAPGSLTVFGTNLEVEQRWATSHRVHDAVFETQHVKRLEITLGSDLNETYDLAEPGRAWDVVNTAGYDGNRSLAEQSALGSLAARFGMAAGPLDATLGNRSSTGTGRVEVTNLHPVLARSDPFAAAETGWTLSRQLLYPPDAGSIHTWAFPPSTYYARSGGTRPTSFPVVVHAPAGAQFTTWSGLPANATLSENGTVLEFTQFQDGIQPAMTFTYEDAAVTGVPGQGTAMIAVALLGACFVWRIRRSSREA